LANAVVPGNSGFGKPLTPLAWPLYRQARIKLVFHILALLKQEKPLCLRKLFQKIPEVIPEA
jgi:hypothetical protein